MLKGPVVSLYEISYVLSGKCGVLTVCFAILLRNFGALVINYMIIGDTFSALMKLAFVDEDDAEKESSWFVDFVTSTDCGIIVTALILAPIFLKRKLSKIKIVSYVLLVVFIAILVFIGYEVGQEDQRTENKTSQKANTHAHR